MEYIKYFESKTKFIQFSQLIGKIIDNIYISDDENTIVFETEEKEYHKYNTEIDCCNIVWFNHINGNNNI